MKQEREQVSYSVSENVCKTMALAILHRSSLNLAQTTQAEIELSNLLAVKIRNQLPVLCTCAFNLMLNKGTLLGCVIA